MLSFFPIPYPDELFYSVLARYHIRSGNRSFQQTHTQLFKSKAKQSNLVYLPNNLNYLANNLPINSKQTVDNWRDNHTLYKFYTTFLSPQEVWLVRDWMGKKLISLFGNWRR